MKTSVFLLIAFVVCYCEAVVIVTDQLENPDHPGQCYDSASRTWYTIGAKWQPAGECVQNTCNRGTADRTMTIRGVSCGQVGALPKPECHFSPANPARTYPECCPKPVCPK